MKHIRGFIVSFLSAAAFAGLAWLAFNPHWVGQIQDKFTERKTEIIPEEKAANNLPDAPTGVLKSGPAKLPVTEIPDPDDLPRLENFDDIAKQDFWIGETPCGEEIFEAPKTLAGLGERTNGPLLTQAIKASDGQSIVNQPIFLFKSPNGITLKLVQPKIDYYEVTGRRFRNTQKDIFDRRPLENMRASENDMSTSSSESETNKKTRVTRTADVFSPSTLSYTVSGSRDRYRLVKNKTVMTSAFLVTLPRWKTYDDASAAEQAKWDDFFCNVAHHELGHLRIRLDILAQTLDGYAALPPARSSEEMKDIIVDYRKDISARVQDRQDAYHIYNEGGLRRGMTELPYAQLPFPWLETPDVKTAEQLPVQQ